MMFSTRLNIQVNFLTFTEHLVVILLQIFCDFLSISSIVFLAISAYLIVDCLNALLNAWLQFYVDSQYPIIYIFQTIFFREYWTIT